MNFKYLPLILSLSFAFPCIVLGDNSHKVNATSSDCIEYYDEFGNVSMVYDYECNFYSSENKKLVSGWNYLDDISSMHDYAVEIASMGNKEVKIIVNPLLGVRVDNDDLYDLWSAVGTNSNIKFYGEYKEVFADKKPQIQIGGMLLEDYSLHDAPSFGFYHCDVNIISSNSNSPALTCNNLTVLDSNFNVHSYPPLVEASRCDAINCYSQINITNSTFDISAVGYEEGISYKGKMTASTAINCSVLTISGSTGTINAGSGNALDATNAYGINASTKVEIKNNSDVSVFGANTYFNHEPIEDCDSLDAGTAINSPSVVVNNCSKLFAKAGNCDVDVKGGWAFSNNTSIILNEGVIEATGSVGYNNETNCNVKATINNSCKITTKANRNESENVFYLDDSLSEHDFSTNVWYAKIETLDELSLWAVKYLHIDSYNENLGECLVYYSSAKTELLKLDLSFIKALVNDDSYIEYRARYEAWARMNNDDDPYNSLLTGLPKISNSTNFISSLSKINNVNNIPIIIVSVISLSSLLLFIMVKKRKITK